MWNIFAPFLFAASITGPLYYIVEILLPYNEALEKFEKSCADKDGMVYEQRGQPKLCIKKEIIKIE